MEGTLLDVLLEYGSLGLFAAFLVWQHLNMQKRFDNLVLKFQETISSMRAEQKKEIEGIRERYDKVISTYNEERTEVRINVAQQVAKCVETINLFEKGIMGKIELLEKTFIEKGDSLESVVDNLPFQEMRIQIEAISLSQRNSHTIIEKGMEIVKDIEEEQKLRTMAKKLSDSKE